MPSSARESVDPRPSNIREFILHFVVRASRSFQHMKTVISPFDQMKRSPPREILANRLEQVELGQFVPGPLEEKQGNAHLLQVLAPLDTGLLGRMQGKPEENDALDGF